MDFQSMALNALIACGIVNVISFFKPDLDSRVKFAVSFAAAFGFSFIPTNLASLLVDKMRDAIEVALSLSGAYKLAQKVGGK